MILPQNNIFKTSRFKNLDEFEVLGSDFPVLWTSAVCSLNDLYRLNNLCDLSDLYSLVTSKKNDGSIIPGTKITKTCPF